MSGDALKKVKPGDPLRIPAAAYNRFIDAARALQGPAIKPGTRGFNLPAGIVPACNASGIDAPMGAAVELAPRSETQAQVEFVRPGQDRGAGVHGIACEPISPGRMGRVAVSGGPHRVILGEGDAPTCGQKVGPVAGTWTASTAGTPKVWTVVADPADSIATVVFSVGGEAAWARATGDAHVSWYYGSPVYQTTVEVVLLSSSGQPIGSPFTVRAARADISVGQEGCLAESADGDPVFIPVDDRDNPARPLCIQVTGTSFDPNTMRVGNIWLRGPD